MPPFTQRDGQPGAGRPPAGSKNRTLMILRVIYVLLLIAGVVGIAFGALQGAWLLVVVAVFWISQESRYGVLRKR